MREQTFHGELTIRSDEKRSRLQREDFQSFGSQSAGYFRARGKPVSRGSRSVEPAVSRHAPERVPSDVHQKLDVDGNIPSVVSTIMSTIHEIVTSEEFRNRVSAQIAKEVSQLPATAYDRDDGPVDGSVTSFEIEDGPTFGEPEGEGSDWTIPFEGTGNANVGYITSDSEDRSTDISGPFEGFVEVRMPDSSESESDAEKVASVAKIDVTIELATLKDDEPTAEPGTS